MGYFHKNSKKKNGGCLPKLSQPDGGRDVVLTLGVLFVLLPPECLITKQT